MPWLMLLLLKMMCKIRMTLKLQKQAATEMESRITGKINPHLSHQSANAVADVVTVVLP